MPINFNGKSINMVKFNNFPVSKVYFNNALIFALSGTHIVSEPEYQDQCVWFGVLMNTKDDGTIKFYEHTVSGDWFASKGIILDTTKQTFITGKFDFNIIGDTMIPFEFYEKTLPYEVEIIEKKNQWEDLIHYRALLKISLDDVNNSIKFEAKGLNDERLDRDYAQLVFNITNIKQLF